MGEGGRARVHTQGLGEQTADTDTAERVAVECELSNGWILTREGEDGKGRGK